MTSSNPLFTGPLARPAPTDDALHDALRMRWSPRAFAHQALSAADLKLSFDAARWAQSASNEQPWAFVYAHRAQEDQFQRLLDCLAAGNQVWAKDAAVLIMSAGRKQLTKREGKNLFADYDIGQAAALLTVQATMQGIAVHQMGGFDRAKAQDTLEIPDTHHCVSAIALGYPGDPAMLDEFNRGREAATRERLPQADFVFAGKWQSAAQ